MSTLRDKGFTCPACRKLFSYSSDQVGTTVVCPRCGFRVLIDPQNASEQPPPLPTVAGPLAAPPRRRSYKTCLARSCLIAFAGMILLVVTVVLTATRILSSAFPRRVQNTVYRTCAPLVTRDLLPGIIQIPATLKNTDIAITVTQVSRECPTIYQEALHQPSPTETPVIRIVLSIANNGSKPATYHTWRHLASEEDVRHAATLEDESGHVYGLVSFGPQTWPVGATQQGVIQPGESLTDILMFECNDAARGPYLLTLPGENLGNRSRLRFRVPDAR